MNSTRFLFLLCGILFLGDGSVEGLSRDGKMPVNSFHTHQHPLHRRETEYIEGELLESPPPRDNPSVVSESGEGGGEAATGLRHLVRNMQQLAHALLQGVPNENSPRLPANTSDTYTTNVVGASQGLIDLVSRMQQLSQALQKNNTMETRVTQLHGVTTPLPASSSTSEPEEDPPCEAPFEEIAYRMCILQEMGKKLSWAAAWDYCWTRGAELAQDSVVIKARRYFNDLYGEEGSRVRWPIWVGGKETGTRTNKVWKWADGTPVPQFLWTEGQPRRYGRQRAPDGTCMILDGYKSFYASSLPCHLKRRFVCQRRF